MYKENYYIILLFTALIGCSNVKKVSFEIAVDTTSKPINYQIKKTYDLEEIGVYASNEFDGARLNGFEKVNDSTAQVLITPENYPINNSPYYAFKTWSNKPQSFYFTFKYPEKYKHRYIPKLKVDNNWTVLDSSKVFSNKGSISIKIDLTPKPIIIAAQEVKSSKDVKDWCKELIKGKESFVKLNTYGTSPLKKELIVLDISIKDTKSKDVIVLLTRQHPPEITGYFAFQSFLQTILNDSDLSKAFLNKYHVLAFPIMNPDGVDLGNWRHNTGGVDTNRDWSVYEQPEIKQALKYITKFLKKNKGRLVLGLDFHSTYNDVFYTNEYKKDIALPNFAENWFASLETNIPNYKVHEEAGNSKKPVSKGWFLYGHDAVGITYEIGDDTPKKRIELIGKVSAEQMMQILLK